MKSFLLIFTGVLIFISSFSQIPSGVDISKIDFTQIPANEIPGSDQLKAMGASDAEIQQIMQIKEQKMKENSTEQKQEQTQTKQEQINESNNMAVRQAIKEQKESFQPQNEVKRNDAPDLIYGQEFFRNNSIRFYEKASDVKAPDNYILGSGDELNISVWGFSDYNEVFKVSSDGYISPKETGRIYVKGLKFEDAKALIIQRFSGFLNLATSKIDITLVYSRVITVNIVGEVINPGSYTIPAINTAFNALVVVNGTNAIGSLRKIHIKRGGKIIRTLDLYKFLLNQDTEQDFFLENNDYIFVPPAERVVNITGEVKRPSRYELIENEDIPTLVKYAGGFNAMAYTKVVQVKHLKNNQPVLTDVNLDSLTIKKKKFPLFDGDHIMIKNISDALENYVEMKGMVKIPGIYEFQPGERITDLIKKAEGILDETYLDAGYLVRQKPDYTNEYLLFNPGKILTDPTSPENYKLQRYDIVNIYSKKRFLDTYHFTVTGAVRAPGEFIFGEGLTVKDAVNIAGGVNIDVVYLDKAYIIRENKNDLSKEYVPVNLKEIIVDNNNSSNIPVQQNDILQIFFKKRFTDVDSISVGGAVRQSGTFLYGKNLTVKDAVYLAGGFKPEAANNRIEVSRILGYGQHDSTIRTIVKIAKINYDLSVEKDMENFPLQPYDMVFVRAIPQFEYQENVKIYGEVNYPGFYSLLNKEEKLSDLIQRAGGLTPWAFTEEAKLFREQGNLGYIFLNLRKAVKRPSSKWNYVLKKGDEIIIPKVNELIAIQGEVNYPNIDNIKQINAPMSRCMIGLPKRAGYYVREYGVGFSKNAKRSRTYVVLPGGFVERTKNFGLFRIYPRVKEGSVIHVVHKPAPDADKEKKERIPIDWNRAIENTTIKVTGILTLWLLLTNIVKNN